MAKRSLFSSWMGGIDRHDADGLTKLYRAARHGEVNTVKSLLKRGADPNVRTGCGLTPLHIAAYWGEEKIVKLLLDAKADPNIDNGNGWKPLHSAALNAGLEGRRNVIKLLMAWGAEAYCKDENGWTPADFVDLWEDPDNERLKDIMRHLNKDHDELTGHQPDMKKLGMEKNDSKTSCKKCDLPKSQQPKPPSHKPPLPPAL